MVRSKSLSGYNWMSPAAIWSASWRVRSKSLSRYNWMSLATDWSASWRVLSKSFSRLSWMSGAFCGVEMEKDWHSAPRHPPPSSNSAGSACSSSRQSAAGPPTWWWALFYGFRKVTFTGQLFFRREAPIPQVSGIFYTQPRQSIKGITLGIQPRGVRATRLPCSQQWQGVKGTTSATHPDGFTCTQRQDTIRKISWEIHWPVRMQQ